MKMSPLPCGSGACVYTEAFTTVFSTLDLIIKVVQLCPYLRHKPLGVWISNASTFIPGKHNNKLYM